MNLKSVFSIERLLFNFLFSYDKMLALGKKEERQWITDKK